MTRHTLDKNFHLRHVAVRISPKTHARFKTLARTLTDRNPHGLPTTASELMREALTTGIELLEAHHKLRKPTLAKRRQE